MTPDEARRTRLRQIKTRDPMYAGIVTQAYSGNSRKKAIHAKCLDCCCWQRIEVRHCTSYTCPLWQYRPYQTENEDQNDDSDENRCTDSNGK